VKIVRAGAVWKDDGIAVDGEGEVESRGHITAWIVACTVSRAPLHGLTYTHL